MKTTIDIPDPLFRKAKSRAAELGQSLRQLVTDALVAKLESPGEPANRDPQWMSGFGGLNALHPETRAIQSRIDATFETIEDEDRS